MRRIALACLGAAAIVGTATSQDGSQWGFVSAGADDVRLFYGVPESDVITFSVICNPKTKTLQIIDFVLPRSAKRGQKVRIILTAGSSRASYDGTVVRDRAHGGIYAETPASANIAIFDLLKAAPSLTIAVGAARETLPLKGVAQPLAEMERACPSSR